MANPNDPNDPNYGFDPNDPLNGSDESLRTGAPVISAAPSRVFFVLGIFAVFVIIIGYLLFGRGHKEQIQKTTKVEIAKPQTASVAPALPPCPFRRRRRRRPPLRRHAPPFPCPSAFDPGKAARATSNASNVSAPTC